MKSRVPSLLVLAVLSFGFGAAEAADVSPPALVQDIVLFGRPLQSTGLATDEETAELRGLLRGLSPQVLRTDPGRFDNFLQKYPVGAWTADLQQRLGAFYKRNGYFSRALQSQDEEVTAAVSAASRRRYGSCRRAWRRIVLFLRL